MELRYEIPKFLFGTAFFFLPISNMEWQAEGEK